MNLIKWRKEYSVHVPQMDMQHQQLLQLLNDLLVSLQNNSVEDATSNICGELRRYATEHFAEEEAMLSQMNYTELPIQQKEHQYFIEQLDELFSKIKTDGVSFKEMNLFLRRWFKNHILNEDMKYKPQQPTS